MLFYLQHVQLGGSLPFSLGHRWSGLYAIIPVWRPVAAKREIAASIPLLFSLSAFFIFYYQLGYNPVAS